MPRSGMSKAAAERALKLIREGKKVAIYCATESAFKNWVKRLGPYASQVNLIRAKETPIKG